MLHWLRKLFGSAASVAIDARHDVVLRAPAARAAPPAAPVSEPPSIPATQASNLPPVVPVSAQHNISWLIREDLDARFTSWLFARGDYADLQTSAAERAILQALDRILASPQSGASLVRRMPGVIPQLLQSLRTDDFSGADLARKISNDVVLVAEVIRLANSSLYATDDPIRSIEHAVMVLGHNGLRHLVTSVAFRPIIDLNAGRFSKLVAPRIWLQSEQCAIASRMLATEAGINGFDAFLAGLIQNVGLVVALRVMDETAGDNAAIGSTAFCYALVVKARRLSSAIGHEWKFPAGVITAIDEQAMVEPHARLSAIGANLAIADYLSKLHLLALNGERVDDGGFTDGLSPAERRCYSSLARASATVDT